MPNKYDKNFYENIYTKKQDTENYIGFNDYYKYGVGRRWVRSLITKVFRKIDKNSINKIIDIGCGEGTHTAFLAHIFVNSEVIGVDLSDEAIKWANMQYNNINNLTFLQTDFVNNTINSNGGGYDLVSSFDVLEHIKDWQSFLKDMLSLSNKYILLTFPTGKMPEYEKMYGHLRNFKRGEVEAFLMENNFKKVKTFYAGFPFYSPLGRWYLGLGNNFNNYEENNGSNINGAFTIKQKIFHSLLFILFRYFCFQNIGDRFLGLFEKIDITVNSKGGGG